MINKVYTRKDGSRYKIRWFNIARVLITYIALPTICIWLIVCYYQTTADRINRNYDTKFTAGDIFFGVHERYLNVK